MAERHGSLGYLALKKESTKGSPQIPTVYVPLFDENITTKWNIDDVNPAMGIKAMRWSAMKGMRDHGGDLTVLGDPNIAGYLFDMLLKKGTTTGTGPYTHPFTLDPTTNPNSYTLDIARGQVVFRFFGVEARELSIDFDDNKMLLKPSVSALGSFSVREISSVAGTGPYTITLKTDYDLVPTKGLVGGDLIRFYDVSAGTFIDATVSTVTGDTTFTTSTNPTQIGNGDLVFLRPATPSYSLAPEVFQWAKTEFRFDANASSALTAAQTRVEEGSEWRIVHQIVPDEGAKRSGAYDPASLPRGLGDIEVKTKIFFDNPDDLNRFLSLPKRALVIRHFAGGTNQYELRITVNNMIPSEDSVALKSDEILFEEISWKAVYDTTDGQMFDVKVVNGVATI